MSVLKKLVADVVDEIRGVFSENRKSAPPPRACVAETDEAPQADVFIETDAAAARGILGDVDWDVLTGGEAAVRILGDDGQLIDREHG